MILRKTLVRFSLRCDATRLTFAILPQHKNAEADDKPMKNLPSSSWKIEVADPNINAPREHPKQLMITINFVPSLSVMIPHGTCIRTYGKYETEIINPKVELFKLNSDIKSFVNTLGSTLTT